MAQRPGVRAGVFEGHIPEFHLVAAVRAFFRGKASLVHIVGNVQKGKGGAQEAGIAAHLPQGLKQRGDILGQRCDSADILGHISHSKGPRPGFQAGKDIDNAGKHH